MSWPLASFVIVAVVLVTGWMAYERRQPSARMAAIVAVLAALAALGRDAFVALPDVKPITAMTLAVGYALGPVPGFAVGALGMLVSNFMLGQGPYTPWQMAAWGMVGLAGAALGRLSGRRLGRLSLALACAVAALAAKEIMNVYTWTLGASHTPAALLAVAGQALAYDITDVVASFAFGLLFALELTRVLGRMRSRMEVVWEQAPDSVRTLRGASPAPPTSRGVALGLIALALAAGALLARPTKASAARPRSAAEISYLASAQNADGGFGGARGQPSSELYSAWAAMGLAAAGRDPLSLRRNGHSVLDALRGDAATLSGAGDLERTILALHACGASVRSLPGGDPVARLLRLRSSDGSFGGLANLTAFGVFALRAAGYHPRDSVLLAAARWLERQQEGDGGFGFAGRGGGSDVDDTAAVVQAIAASGFAAHTVLARAATFLARAENADGGFPQQPGDRSNAQSTAWAIQGLVAAGRNIAAVTRGGSRTPLAYLQSLVAPDGSVRYSRTGSQTPVWVTSQALTAIALEPLPIAPVGHARPRALARGAASGHVAGSASSARGRPAVGARKHGRATTAAARVAQLGTVWRAMALLGALVASFSRWLASSAP